MQRNLSTEIKEPSKKGYMQEDVYPSIMCRGNNNNTETKLEAHQQ